jgi:hypothetical protein
MMATPYPLAVNNYILPEIGSIGTYVLAAPYSTIVDPNINYTCSAIRSISELIADNKDPFTLAYQPAGLSQTVYQAAQAQNVPIVFLVSDGGNWVYIPANYIQEIPVVNGVNYQSMGINIILGLIPSNADLTTLMTAIQDTVLATIGITPSTQPVQLSNTLQVTQAQDNQIQVARQAAITNNNSNYGLYMKTLQQLNSATAQIQALEQYIIANQAALGLTPTIP